MDCVCAVWIASKDTFVYAKFHTNSCAKSIYFVKLSCILDILEDMITKSST